VWHRRCLDGCFFEVVEFANDVPVVEALIMWWCIVMTSKQLAGGCWSVHDLGTVYVEPDLLEDAVNQMWLSQVEHPIIVTLDINTKEI